MHGLLRSQPHDANAIATHLTPRTPESLLITLNLNLIIIPMSSLFSPRKRGSMFLPALGCVASFAKCWRQNPQNFAFAGIVLSQGAFHLVCPNCTKPPNSQIPIPLKQHYD